MSPGRRSAGLNVKDEKWLSPTGLRKIREGLLKEYNMLSKDKGAVRALSIQESRGVGQAGAIPSRTVLTSKVENGERLSRHA